MKPKKIKMRYIGRRVFDSDKGEIMHAFCPLNKPDDIRYWKKAKWCRIGRLYEVTAKGKSFQLPSVPNEVDGPDATDLEIEKWQLEDQATYAFLVRKKESMRAKNFQWENLTVREIKEKLDRQNADWDLRGRIGSRIEIFLKTRG